MLTWPRLGRVRSVMPEEQQGSAGRVNAWCRLAARCRAALAVQEARGRCCWRALHEQIQPWLQLTGCAELRTARLCG